MARIELIDDDEQPVHAPRAQPPRRPRPDASARKAGVGGHVAASMKRGMQPRPEGGARLWVLGGIALVLLLALNWSWLARIHTRVQSAGGAAVVADRARAWAARVLQPGPAPEPGGRRPFDEV